MDEVILVSIAMEGVAGDGGSNWPDISADSRFVVFESSASNLVAGDGNNVKDIFLRDTLTGVTVLISSGVQGPSNGESSQPAISANGRYVVFHSSANNLVAGDGNLWDVFLKDTQTGAFTLVSADSAGQQANSTCSGAAVSADGRYVAFHGYAGNLVPNDDNGTWDIFLKDVQTGAISLLTSTGQGQADSWSLFPSMSDDGRYIAFYSDASNLVANDANGTWDIFLKDVQTGAMTLVSMGDLGSANGTSSSPMISADGHFIVFQSDASNLVAADVNQAADIFLKDLVTGTLTLVSSGASGQGNGFSYFPTISGDGRYVVFSSEASNLVAGDNNGIADVFVKDLQTGAISLLTSGATGTGLETSPYPHISADGSSVAFDSDAENLADNDSNSFSDVFIVQNPLQSGQDSIPPAVTSFSPADEETGVAIDRSVVLVFDEPIQRGTGTISLRLATGTLIETFDAATSMRLSIAAATLTLDLTVDLDSNTSYRLEFDNGTVQDLAGNAYAGTTSYGFMTGSGTTSDDVIQGTPESDQLYGDDGDDQLYGFAEDDALYGGEGNDLLDGGTGSDYMEGGTGSDTYYVDDAGDQVIEAESQVVRRAIGGDIDTVIASIDYVLGTYLEDLALAGLAQTGTGNALDNVLTGNTENNTLTGLAGNDTLDGAAGTDTAVFTGNRSAYTITRTSTGYTVSGSTDGTDTLTSIERARFADQTLDLAPLSDYGTRLQVFATAWLDRQLTPEELILYAADYAQVAASGGNIYDTDLHAFFLANDAGNFLDNPDPADMITDMYERLTGTRDVPQEMLDTFIDRLENNWRGPYVLAVKMIKAGGFWVNTDGSYGVPANFRTTSGMDYADETNADLPALQAQLADDLPFVIPDDADDALILVGVAG